METTLDRLMLLLILSDVALLATTRLRSVLRLFVLQGALLAALAVIAPAGPPSVRALSLGAAALCVRSLLFPWLLARVARRSGIPNELRPLVGLGPSLLLGMAMLAGAMMVGKRLPLGGPGTSDMVIPAALFTIFTGLFLVVTRRKALTQCLGYLALENGIYGFGVAAVGEVPALVELGALLDLFLAVLVMGIAMHRLSETFDNMDTDQLTALRG
jgi:hydrogenase-4 component E